MDAGKKPGRSAGEAVSRPLILVLETSSRIGSVGLAEGPDLLAERRFSGPMMHGAEMFPAIEGLLGRFGRQAGGIEQIHLSIGPGSFTGLRIAVTMAKVMHLARPVRVAAVDTLDAVAANITELSEEELAAIEAGVGSHWPAFSTADERPRPIRKVAAVLDAKRGQFYVAVYARQVEGPARSEGARGGGQGCRWRRIRPAGLIGVSEFLAEFADPEDPVALIGDGLLYHAERFAVAGTVILGREFWPARAAMVHALGWRMAEAGRFSDPVRLVPRYIRRPEAEEKWQGR